MDAIKRTAVFLRYIFNRFKSAKILLLSTIFLLMLDYLGMSILLLMSNPEGEGLINEFWRTLIRNMSLGINAAVVTWIFLLLLALRSVSGYFHSLASITIAKKVHNTLSKEIFGVVILEAPLSELYQRSVGHYISLAGDDTFKAGGLINQFFQIISQLSSVLVGFLLLYIFSVYGFILTFAFLLLSGFFVLRYLRKITHLNAISIEKSREASTVFLEALNGLRSVRAMLAQNHFNKYFGEKIDQYIKSLKLIEHIKLSVKFVPAFIAILVGLILLNPWATATLEFTQGKVFAGTIILVRLFSSLGALMTILGSFIVDSQSAKDLDELIAVDSSVHDYKNNLPEIKINTLSIINLSCGYPGSDLILLNSSYSFMRGRSYAIIGPSGVGKSTIADVLSGLLVPVSGKILINDLVANSNDLNNSVRLIEQQPKIFSLSVRDNLTLGDMISDYEILEVLDVVGLRDFVESLPGGLNTLMDYQGDNISGGQRQRFAIARALLRRPEVLILDEVTSALDADARDNFLMNVKNIFSSCILIFITHDSEVAKFTDEVLGINVSSKILEKVSA